MTDSNFNFLEEKKIVYLSLGFTFIAVVNSEFMIMLSAVKTETVALDGKKFFPCHCPLHRQMEDRAAPKSLNGQRGYSCRISDNQSGALLQVNLSTTTDHRHHTLPRLVTLVGLVNPVTLDSGKYTQSGHPGQFS